MVVDGEGSDEGMTSDEPSLSTFWTPWSVPRLSPIVGNKVSTRQLWQ